MAGKEKDPLKANHDKTARECLAEEADILERVDEQGVQWRKVYFVKAGGRW